ncbi:MAG: MerR family transcriptional regulator [Polyangiaceae bacterium]
MSNVRLPILKSDRRAEREPAAADDELMQVGDLASRTGKTVRAIHLYEELELLKPAARSKGRFRLYGPEALLRVRWIGKLQDMGLSLTDIKSIVRDWEDVGTAPAAMTKMREVYKAKLAETQKQIEHLRNLQREILASLTYLDTCDVCDPSRLLGACSCCDHHPEDQEVPDLVAGFRA